MQPKKIVIIGNGAIGHAILHLLKKSGRSAQVWDKDQAKNISGSRLDEVLPGADFLFLCIPSWYMEEALSEISASIEPQTAVISLSKGLNAVSHQTMDELIKSALPENRLALMSGPMLAAEIMEDKGSSAVIAADKEETYEEITGLFSGSNIKLEYSGDIRSVALSAVLKNIYTLFIGMLDGIGEGENTKGYFMAKSSDEILAILDIAGADISTGLGIAGLGDFIATATSAHSTNRQVGEELGRTGSASKRSEGLVSLPSILELAADDKKNLPILSALEAVILKNKSAKKEIEKLLAGE